MSELYIGLMSGTSLDGIDAALVDCSDQHLQLIASHTQAFDETLRNDLLEFINNSEHLSLAQYGDLDARLGDAYAAQVHNILSIAQLHAKDITAIGSHGQTVFHQPSGAAKNSIQIGDPNRIAQQTGIATAADFRRADMAQGGQGAPLVPAFHQAVLHSNEKNRCILNIGGIANITILPKHKNKPISGYDTGPGNVLMDSWIQQHKNEYYDKNGAWAEQGKVIDELINEWLKQDYFQQPAPKSTGRELFNLNCLAQHKEKYSSEDLQRTLLELTVRSISQEIQKHPVDEIYVCGGGAKNDLLMRRLKEINTDQTVSVTNELGIPADDMEAIAFAWLAKQRINQLPGNCPSVTGAKNSVILGSIYQPNG